MSVDLPEEYKVILNSVGPTDKWGAAQIDVLITGVSAVFIFCKGCSHYNISQID